MKPIWKKAIHKTIACMLLASMVCTLLPVVAFAQMPTVTFTATGPNEGNLNIDNIESMESPLEYSVDGGAHWYQMRIVNTYSIQNVSVEHGIQVREYFGSGSTEEPDIQVINVTRAATPNVSYTQPTTQGGQGVIEMQAGIHEYRNENTGDITNGSWKTATGNTSLPMGTYFVRVKAGGTVLTSENQVITLQYTEQTSDIGIDYADETLTGFELGSGYTITVDGKSNPYYWMRETTVDIKSSWFGKTIGIVKIANGDSGAANSESKSLTIPTKPATPQAQGVPCTATGVNDGKLIKVDSTMQYCKAGDSAWITVAGDSATGLAAGNYEVRCQATSSQFASDIQTVVVGVTTSATPDEKPTASINFMNETLTGFIPDAIYTIRSDTYSEQVKIDQTGTWAIANECFGTTVTIVCNYDGKESEPQQLSIPARPDAPNVKAVTIELETTGTITQTNTKMEYRVKGASTWTAVQGASIPDLAINYYEVRYKATNETFSSEIKMVTVGRRNATPTAEIDYVNEILTSLKRSSTYAITVGATTTEHTTSLINDTLEIQAEWYGTEIAIVQKGNSSSLASEAQRLIIPAKPVAPTVTAVDCSPSGIADGKITDVDSTMEYCSSTNATWIAITGTELANLAAGTYQVRVTASNENKTFVGEAVEVRVLTKKPTPNVGIDYIDKLLMTGSPSTTYTINGTLFTTDSLGCVKIADSWFGTTVEIVRLGDATTTANSAPQSLAIPAIPPAPTSIKSVPYTVGNVDGKITGVNNGMEYSTDGRVWNAITGTEIADLAVGSYYVRVKETTATFASESADVSIVAVCPVLTGNNQQIIVGDAKDIVITLQIDSTLFSQLNLGNDEVERYTCYELGEGVADSTTPLMINRAMPLITNHAMNGTTLLTLKADYVKTLPVGEHTFTAIFGQVYGIINLTVKPTVATVPGGTVTAPSTVPGTTVTAPSTVPDATATAPSTVPFPIIPTQATHVNPQTGVK